MRQQRVLLRLVKPMNLVHKQQRATSQPLLQLGFFNGRPNIFNACQYRRKRDEMRVEGLRRESGERGFSDPGWTPKNHGMRFTRIEYQTQRPPRPEQMGLPNHLVEALGTEGFSERSAHPPSTTTVPGGATNSKVPGAKASGCVSDSNRMRVS